MTQATYGQTYLAVTDMFAKAYDATSRWDDALLNALGVEPDSAARWAAQMNDTRYSSVTTFMRQDPKLESQALIDAAKVAMRESSTPELLAWSAKTSTHAGEGIKAAGEAVGDAALGGFRYLKTVLIAGAVILVCVVILKGTATVRAVIA